MIANKNTLLPALQAVGKAIGRRVVIPILEDILFDLDGETLSLSASNLESTIKTTCKVDGKEKIKMALPGDLVIQTIKAMPEGPITFRFDKKDMTCTISGDSNNFKVFGEDGELFPKIEFPEGVSIPMSAIHLQTGLHRTIPFVGDNEFKPQHMCIFIEAQNNAASFTATDDNSLSHVEVQNECGETASAMLPITCATILKDLFTEGDIMVTFNDNNISISNKEVTFIGRVSSDRFPNYRAIPAVSYAARSIVDRQLLLNALRRILIYAKDNPFIKVLLKFSNGTLNLKSAPTPNGHSASEEVLVEYEGEDFEMGLNAKCFTTVLSSFTTDTVALNMNSFDKPIVVDTEEDKGSYCVLMPVVATI